MRDYSNSEMTNIINEWIHSKRDRENLLLCYVDGLTHERIAERYDLTPRSIDNIISKYTLVIEKHLL